MFCLLSWWKDQDLNKKFRISEEISTLNFLNFLFLVIKTLDPELDADPDTQFEKMLDPDPYPQ